MAASVWPEYRKVEEPDMSRLSCGHAGGDIFGRRQGRSCRSGVAFTHQDLGLARVRNGESRIGGERAVEGLDRTGIHGERQIEALYIGVPRGGGGSGHGEVIAVCEHHDSLRSKATGNIICLTDDTAFNIAAEARGFMRAECHGRKGADVSALR